jgi:hypothetical protein
MFPCALEFGGAYPGIARGTPVSDPASPKIVWKRAGSEIGAPANSARERFLCDYRSPRRGVIPCVKFSPFVLSSRISTGVDGRF